MELTLSGTDRLAVRNIASAMPCAYQGYKERQVHKNGTQKYSKAKIKKYIIIKKKLMQDFRFSTVHNT